MTFGHVTSPLSRPWPTVSEGTWFNKKGPRRRHHLLRDAAAGRGVTAP